MRIAINAAALALSTLFVMGCGGGDGDKPVAATREQIQNRMPPLLTEMTNDSVQVIQDVGDSPAFDMLGDSLDSVIPVGGDTAEPLPPMPGGIMQGAYRIFRRFAIEHALVNTLEEQTTGDRAVAFLLDEVFTAENYEGDGVWRVHGATVCGEVCSGSAPTVPGGTPPTDECTPDAACVSQVDQFEIRIRVTLGANGGLDFTLLIGPAKDEVLTLELRPNAFKISADLAAIKGAITHVAMVLGEMPMLPSVLEGQVSFSITLNGRRDVTFEASVERAIRLEMMVEGRPFQASIEARTPMLSLRARDTDPLLTVKVDVGRARLSGPLADDLQGTLGIDFGGLDAETELGRGMTAVTFSNLGLGDTTTEVTLDGTRLIGIDLNPGSGRHTSVTIRPRVLGQAEIAIAPELDLVAAFHLQPAAAQGHMIESYLLDETYRFTASGPPTLQPIDRVRSAMGLLKVVMGQLSISSSSVPAAITVDTGACLTSHDPVTAGEHPLLGQLASVACP